MVLVARSVLSHTAAHTPGGPQVVDFQAKRFIRRGGVETRLRARDGGTIDIVSSKLRPLYLIKRHMAQTMP
jgi:hypothetical protein